MQFGQSVSKSEWVMKWQTSCRGYVKEKQLKLRAVTRSKKAEDENLDSVVRDRKGSRRQDVELKNIGRSNRGCWSVRKMWRSRKMHEMSEKGGQKKTEGAGR